MEIPTIIESNKHDNEMMTINRQLLIQLYDKGLLSRQTLLAAFSIDSDKEDAQLKAENP